jgi:hypothetical protein
LKAERAAKLDLRAEEPKRGATDAIVYCVDMGGLEMEFQRFKAEKRKKCENNVLGCQVASSGTQSGRRRERENLRQGARVPHSCNHNL